MASTYTSNSGIQKPATGEQSGTWGDTTNLNFDIIDRLSSGVGDITLSGTTHTLTTTDGALSEGQYKVLVLGGSPSGTNTITISPNDQEKMYLVFNNSGQDAVFTQGSGGNVTVPNGASKIIYSDGAGSGAAVTDFTGTLDVDLKQLSIDGTLITATGAELNYVDGVTSAIQTQLNAKQATITGAATTVDDADLTINRALISNGSGKIAVSDVTSTELGYLDGVTSNVQSQLNNIVTTPAGVISAFAGSSAPSGWFLCYGQAVSRTTYATLFSAIGTTYGSGDGSTTFNLPDLRGRVVAGVDDMGGTGANRLTLDTTEGVDGGLGDSGGVQSHVLTTAEMPSHSHSADSIRARTGGSNETSGTTLSISSRGSPYSYTTGLLDQNTGATGSSGGHVNVQPTLVLNYIIKT